MTALTAAAPASFTIAGVLTRLLQRSPVMLPVPGTSTHMEHDIAAVTVELSDEDFERSPPRPESCTAPLPGLEGLLRPAA